MHMQSCEWICIVVSAQCKYSVDVQWVCVYLSDLPLLYSQVHTIETPHGDLHITLHGSVNTRRPAILTYHDVGMESEYSPAVSAYTPDQECH